MINGVELRDNSMIVSRESDSVEILLATIEKYRDELANNREILVNAIDLCKETLNETKFVKEQIKELEEALYETDNTQEYIEQFVIALKNNEEGIS